MVMVQALRIDTSDPGKAPVLTTVDTGDIKFVNEKIHEPLANALVNGTHPRLKHIRAEDLQVDPNFYDADVYEEYIASFAAQIKSHYRMGQEFEWSIPVMQRSDGTHWVYDDIAYVLGAKRADPTLRLRCAVYRDPTK